ncbi:hypothetical protein Pcinc_007546 [Petrolisthes cinctipes]|uniref:Uncharacterized protein n=1 Tax=Petrolisthes cinctipes TaxID=88211 RepID=A0AAE1G8A9_PETCI|nr:hypothetical protein Pcinc_007546 [Petrolisthes cinctipes]
MHLNPFLCTPGAKHRRSLFLVPALVIPGAAARLIRSQTASGVVRSRDDACTEPLPDHIWDLTPKGPLRQCTATSTLALDREAQASAVIPGQAFHRVPALITRVRCHESDIDS